MTTHHTTPRIVVPQFVRPDKDEMIRARCSTELKARLLSVCGWMDKDASDFIREAVSAKVAEAESKLRAAAA